MRKRDENYRHTTVHDYIRTLFISFDHSTTLSFTINSQADTTSKNITDSSTSEKLIHSRLKSKRGLVVIYKKLLFNH